MTSFLCHVLELQLIKEKCIQRSLILAEPGQSWWAGSLDTGVTPRESIGRAQGVQGLKKGSPQTLTSSPLCERGQPLHDLLRNLWILITAPIYQDIYHTVSFAAVQKQCFQISFTIDSKKSLKQNQKPKTSHMPTWPRIHKPVVQSRGGITALLFSKLLFIWKFLFTVKLCI